MEKRIHLLVRGFVFFVFTACFLKRAGLPAIADEMAFTRPALAWIQSGPQAWGVWHSPVFPWVLMLVGKIFGPKIAAYRALGFISLLASSFLVALTFERLRPKATDLERTLLWALTLLAPVTIGSALILDYDNTFLVLGTALFFYALVRLEGSKASSIMKALVLGACIGLSLLGKETTPLVYPLGVWILLGSFWMGCLSGALGIAIFCGVSWLWCRAYGIPFQTVFDMDLLGLRGHGMSSLDAGLARQLYIKLSPVFWVGMPLVGGFFLSLRELFRGRRSVVAITSVVLAVLISYTFVLRQMTYHFPKYMTPALLWLPFLVLVARPWRSFGFAGLWVLMLLIYGWVAVDPLSPLYERSFVSAAYPLLFFAVPFILWLLLKGSRKNVPSAAAMAFLSGVALNAAYVKTTLFSDVSTTYWYGERAFTEAAAAVRDWKADPRNSGGRVISTAEDIAYSMAGIEFLPPAQAGDPAAGICHSSVPVLFVSRIREASSLLVAPELEKLRACLPVSRGKDILFAKKRPNSG